MSNFVYPGAATSRPPLHHPARPTGTCTALFQVTFTNTLVAGVAAVSQSQPQPLPCHIFQCCHECWYSRNSSHSSADCSLAAALWMSVCTSAQQLCMGACAVACLLMFQVGSPGHLCSKGQICGALVHCIMVHGGHGFQAQGIWVATANMHAACTSCQVGLKDEVSMIGITRVIIWTLQFLHFNQQMDPSIDGE